MIISHKYRYVFIELPHTGTRAINRELIEYYGGERILSHHSNLFEFLRIANNEERKYFKFSGIRNPLDLTVSQYFKYKGIAERQKDGLMRNAGRHHSRRRRIREIVFDRRLNGQLAYLSHPDRSFSDYFRKYYKWPYDNFASVCHKHCDMIIRFESLQEDFSRVLERLGIDQVRPLPRKGQTASRRGHLDSFYTEPLRLGAVEVFGPFMERWNYDFPSTWGDVTPSTSSRMSYKFLAIFRHNYWRYLRPYL